MIPNANSGQRGSCHIELTQATGWDLLAVTLLPRRWAAKRIARKLLAHYPADVAGAVLTSGSERVAHFYGAGALPPGSFTFTFGDWPCYEIINLKGDVAPFTGNRPSLPSP